MACLKTMLIIAFLFSGVALAEEGAGQSEIRDLLDAFLQGASSNDAQMHDRFWHESLVYTSSTGARFGKSEIMDGLAQSGTNEDDGPFYTAEAVHVRLLNDVAIVTFRLLATSVEGHVEREFYNTGVLQRFDANWKAVTWQATRIPEVDE